MALAAVLSLSACSSISYYSQALRGHLDLTGRKQEIDQLIADPGTAESLRKRLQSVRAMRHFAIESLALPDSGSYTHYADLERDVTLWLLSAAPELSLQPKTWCYPFVGCLAYRGYFQRAAAEKLAARLQRKGYDTSISPSLAYSTLGLAKDPVLSTMLAYDDAELAGILFHEMAHELTFVRGDTRFSESFASTVERVGRQRWLALQGQAPDRDGERLKRERARQFNRLLLEIRAELEQLFASDQDQRAGKDRIYRQLDQRYQDLKIAWQGDPGFDRWMARNPNNADLALVASYELAVPAFLKLLEQHDGDLPAFYRAVEALSRLSPQQRETRLSELIELAKNDMMNQ